MNVIWLKEYHGLQYQELFWDLEKFRRKTGHFQLPIEFYQLLINNYSPKAKWLSMNIHRDEVEVNIHL